MLVILDVQHIGKPHRPDDRGACHDGDEEAGLAMRYALSADKRLRHHGHKCIIVAEGHYASRWDRANAYGAQVYVACHVNAGGGDRAEIYYDHRTSPDGGVLLASKVGEFLQLALEGLEVRTIAARPMQDGQAKDAPSRAFNTFKGVIPHALCFEPYFIDGPQADLFRQSLGIVGYALADGINAWAKERGLE